METKKEFSMNIGLPSIMLIFVVLCLVSFGVLSLVSANADKRLSEKVLTRQAQYYEACNEAQEMLSVVDAQLHTAYAEAADRTEYISLIEGIPTTYSYEVGDVQSLEVRLSFLYPEAEDGDFYQIMEWKVVTDEDGLDYDESLHLIQIEDVE
jgi:hypothetical protein